MSAPYEEPPPSYDEVKNNSRPQHYAQKPSYPHHNSSMPVQSQHSIYNSTQPPLIQMVPPQPRYHHNTPPRPPPNRAPSPIPPYGTSIQPQRVPSLNPSQQPSAPYLTLLGPDSHTRQLCALDSLTNQRRPIFIAHTDLKAKPQVSLSRLVQGGLQQPISSASVSSLSSKMILYMHLAQLEIKLKHEFHSAYAHTLVMDVPRFRKLTWRPTPNGTGWICADARGVDVARYKFWKREPELMVYVQLPDELVDVIVTASLAMMVDEKKGLGIVGEVLGAI